MRISSYSPRTFNKTVRELASFVNSSRFDGCSYGYKGNCWIWQLASAKGAQNQPRQRGNKGLAIFSLTTGAAELMKALGVKDATSAASTSALCEPEVRRGVRISTRDGVMGAVSVPATEFSRNFAKYRDEAIEAKVISVTSHGRVIGGYLSASELARYEQMKRRERKILVVGELDDETIASIQAAEYGVAPK